jgi:carbon starvation protein
MNTLLLIFVCGAGYLVAYYTYGRFLARKIFKLDKEKIVPSVELKDGVDYVPTRKGIIFGHHYTSIAGTGPIVGPAIGIIWGWLPAILWLFFGSIFMGAVHDFGALVVSLRNEGKSISEAAAKYINMRVRFIFFAVVFLSLLIVIAIFGVVIAAVFTRFPRAVIPVWLQIPIAVSLGFAVYKRSANVTLATTLAVAGMYACIVLGSDVPIKLGTTFGIPPTGLWVIILLIYAWVASTLPVTTLLQPRDYINAWQLFIAMGLLVGGVAVSSLIGGLPLVAPAFNKALPADAPPIWPSMFVVIACGAISGFHSLVASGTSAKQVAREPDSQLVGYGSMLLESFLAVLVLVCVAAGIGIALTLQDGTVLTGKAAWLHQYSAWIGEKGLTDKIAPVVVGAANMMAKLGLPHTIGITLMGVFIASFAGTTLDTSTRAGNGPEDPFPNQQMGGNHLRGADRRGISVRYGSGRHWRDEALASLRDCQPASGSIGFAGGHVVFENQGRLEVRGHRPTLPDHAGHHQLGDGQERDSFPHQCEVCQREMAPGAHRSGDICAGIMDDRRGLNRFRTPTFYGFSSEGIGISLNRAMTGG